MNEDIKMIGKHITALTIVNTHGLGGAEGWRERERKRMTVYMLMIN